MDNGWIKLYRQSKKNPLMRDYKAWAIFCWILLSVDRETAKMILGRFWAAAYFEMSPSTFYKALKRLEQKYNVITLSSNNKHTEVSVLNWAKYQDNNVTVTTKGQQSNNKVTHIQEYRIKNNNTNVLLGNKITREDKEINSILNAFEKHIEHIPADRKPRFVAQHIKQRIHTFIKYNKELFFELRGVELTFDYVLGKAWGWYRDKDYSQHTEKLETFKLKMIVYLDDVSKNLIKEKEVRDNGKK